MDVFAGESLALAEILTRWLNSSQRHVGDEAKATVITEAVDTVRAALSGRTHVVCAGPAAEISASDAEIVLRQVAAIMNDPEVSDER